MHVDLPNFVDLKAPTVGELGSGPRRLGDGVPRSASLDITKTSCGSSVFDWWSIEVQ